MNFRELLGLKPKPTEEEIAINWLRVSLVGVIRRAIADNVEGYHLHENPPGGPREPKEVKNSTPGLPSEEGYR